MEQRTGVRPDLASGETHRNVFFPTLYYFLFEDPLFQEWLLHPVLLALVTYLLGESCVLTTTAVFMKGPADESERRAPARAAQRPADGAAAVPARTR